MFSTKPVYQSLNLLTLSLLPKNWINQIENVVNKYAQYTTLDGHSSTSREPEGSKPVEVFVVTGDVVKVHLTWLYDLYLSVLREFATKVAGYPVYPSGDEKSAININVLRGKGARYEWHVDSNPLTGILYVTTHTPQDGGELIFKLDAEQILVHPEAGMFVAFDARHIPHTVALLKSEGVRISIPMNYYHSTEEQDRPADLDTYLYEEPVRT